MRKKDLRTAIIIIVLLVMTIVEGYQDKIDKEAKEQVLIDREEVHPDTGSISQILNSYGLKWEDKDENYLDLDDMNRVQGAYAVINKYSLPTTERKSIQKIHPTGWKNKKYDVIPGGYLYNRCHLIGHQLTGQNDNWKNLMTCTRQANSAMIPYETIIKNQVLEGDTILYIVVPVFKGQNKLASSIKMGAYRQNKVGTETSYKKIFTTEIPNTQKGIDIDYKTGTSRAIK